MPRKYVCTKSMYQNYVCTKSMYQKKHGKFPITNKTGHLKVQIKASFCKTLVASAPTFGIL